MVNMKAAAVVEDVEQEACETPWADIIHAMIVDSERERIEERPRQQSRRSRHKLHRR